MIGIDEVGRGCWAGPMLIVAARQLRELPLGLNDSKKLTRKQRESFIEELNQSCEIGEGWVSAQEIDKLGLTLAMKLATSRALRKLNAQNDDVIIFDGLINYCADSFINVTCVAKADSKFPIVSAASIWAKVIRDKYMIKVALDYPDYGFARHVGYGTSKHSLALVKHGITPLHRLSFKPVRNIYDSH